LGSLTLVAGNPGTGKTILCGEFLHHGATRGENGLYISLSEGRDARHEAHGPGRRGVRVGRRDPP